MKRVLAVVVGAGIALGGGAAAWAQTAGAPKRAAAKECLAQAKADPPGADKATLKASVTACLAAQGITPKQLTPEQQAKRDTLKSCLQGVKSANPDATKAELRTLAKPCLEQAGITPDQIRPKVAAAKACLAKARADHPDAARAELRQDVKACVQAGS